MPDQTTPTLLHQSTCPACGHHVAVPFLDYEQQPLAVVAWPATRQEAQAMPRLPLEFVRCINCGHVYNIRFDYTRVPYSDKPSLMFNKGAGWSQHLEWVRDKLLEDLGDCPTVVEIGCGEGHLLRALAHQRPGGRYLGFDPNATVDTGGQFEARALLFEPGVHLGEIRPDLLISRHVLEHLVNPLGFLQSIAFAAASTGLTTKLFLEVPCIDRCLETGRTVDFYYEHNSHFTTHSFTRMLERFATEVKWIQHGYDGEVIGGLVRLSGGNRSLALSQEAAAFRLAARHAVPVIRQQLADLHASGRRVAIWGGTGKAAAFLNHYGVDADRFPLVVDSDATKFGTYVPGMGQEILPRDTLRAHPAEVVVIPMQWRAADILREMQQHGIAVEQVLIEHRGRLIDFFREPHPYPIPEGSG